MLRRLIIAGCVLLPIAGRSAPAARGPAPAPAGVARVMPYRGKPAVTIDGRPIFPFAMLSLGSDDCRREWAATGAHLYTIDCGLGNTFPGRFDAASVNRAFAALLAVDPRALVFPRIPVTAPAWWIAANPDEECIYEGGKRSGVQSMASRKWLRDMGEDLDRFVRHVRTAPYAAHVIGFHICSGTTAEWQAWGLWDGETGDFSPACVRAFRDWLRARYGVDARLQAAWRDPAVTLATAAIPGRADRLRAGRLLRRDAEARRVLDFYAFWPNPVADAICHFARVARRASAGQSLIGFFYGYAPQYAEMANESQHLALDRVLASPDVDFLCSPAMYSGRQPGGTSTFMSATASVRLHGKFWFDESDIRTHQAANPLARCADERESIGVLKREFANVVASGAGMWWFDMEGGWFRGPAFSALFRSMRDAGESLLRDPLRVDLPEEIAFVLDEKSFHRNGPPGSPLSTPGVLEMVSQAARIGAPVGLYLLSDLPRMPRHRLVVFLNAIDLTAADRRAIDALKRGGVTLVFAYGAGIGSVSGGGATESEAGMEALTGMRIAITEKPGLMLAASTSGVVFGVSHAASPRFVVQDPEATVLAQYADRTTAVARRDLAGWTSVFCGVPGMPMAFLRHLAREAGVHVLAGGADTVIAGGGIVAVHASTSGAKTITLPGRCRIDELCAQGAPLRAVGNGINFTMRERETRIFRIRREPARKGSR